MTSKFDKPYLVKNNYDPIKVANVFKRLMQHEVVSSIVLSIIVAVEKILSNE